MYLALALSGLILLSERASAQPGTPSPDWGVGVERPEWDQLAPSQVATVRTRQAAGGASYGGHLANWMEGTTTRYKAIISHAGLATLDMQWGMSDGIYHRELMMGGPYWDNPQKWIDQSPLAKAGNFKTPMLLSVSDNDFRVPQGNTLTMYSALKRMNVPSKLLVWPDENHWILKGENSRVFYREARAWLEKYVLGTNADSQ